jgi:hypothetical protein
VSSRGEGYRGKQLKKIFNKISTIGARGDCWGESNMANVSIDIHTYSRVSDMLNKPLQTRWKKRSDWTETVGSLNYFQYSYCMNLVS